ncbi:carbohydrate kinase family protein [Streptacidiphilus cavernicola]|uniref:Carbohydrate kinase family protein n=1 Tax=Streptacidiphilus cavernicola TaxID=3342716 RepID=A0ABV6W0P4_9ACTN
MSQLPPESDVVVLGFNTLDLVFSGPDAIRPDQKIHSTGLLQIAGGQGANAAVDLAGLGLAVQYAGMFGDDAWGGLSAASLTDAGIGTAASRTVADCPNHVAVVVVDTTHDTRSIVMCKDPRLTAPADLVDERLLRTTRALYTDGHEFELSVAAAALAASLGVPVFSDLESLRPDTDRLLRHVGELVAPLAVLAELTGATDEAEILAGVRKLGPAVVVATKGGEGCSTLDEQGRLVVLPAVPTEVVDSTGAGDAFHAGYLAARLRGAGIVEAAELGNRAGALKCRFPGPRVPPEAMAALRTDPAAAG